MTLAHHRLTMAALAHALPPQLPDNQLGDITLHPHQRDAVDRLTPILQRFHGALLADDVGLGKTYIALAIARRYTHVHIIAPATLLPMWRTARIHAHATNTSLHSLQAFSLPDIPTLPTLPDTLVIIDEAHHLRSPRTARYRTVARAIAGADLLLISATPLHNTPNDLRHLLALFLGHRADVMTPQMLARTIVRRTNAHTISTSLSNFLPTTQPPTPVPHLVSPTPVSPTPVSPTPTSPTPPSPTPPSHASVSPTPTSPPPVSHHPPHTHPHDRETLSLLLALPAPLPTHDGATAGALIRLGLLRAWCSSDAALAHALRQRRLRGEALRQALDAGRHPSHTELRSWMVGDHDVQLAFPELLATAPLPADTPPGGESLQDTLQHHLDALAHLAEHHERTATADPVRAKTLRQLLDHHPGTPVVAFSQFTHTVRALYRALADIAGVGLLTGRHARIASGTITRDNALARFAPSAHGRAPPPPHQAIRLLLTTDLLAEGVNLQDAGVVVHLDLPWTAARLTQRTGRCARMGSPHATVHVHTFAPPPAIDAHLRLHHHLVRKGRLAHHLLGTPLDPAVPAVTPARATPPHAPVAMPPVTPPVTPLASPVAASALHALLQQWRRAAPASPPTPVSAPARPLVSILHASTSGWLAAVHCNGALRLVGGTPATRPTTRVRTLLHLAEAATRGTPPPPDADVTSRGSLRAAERAVRRQLRAEGVVRRGGRGLGPSSARLALVQRQAHALLQRRVQELSPTSRHAQRGAIVRARALIDAARHAGAQAALRRWLAEHSAAAAPEWLRGWERYPELAALLPSAPLAPAAPPAGAGGAGRSARRVRAGRRHGRLHALLLLLPEPSAALGGYASACSAPRGGSPSSSTLTAP